MKTLISLQQDFLPTDTVVDIPAILQDYPDSSLLLNWIGWGAIMLGIMFVIASLEEGAKLPAMPFGFVSALVGIVVIICNSLFTQSKVDEFYAAERAYNIQVVEQSEKNRENLFANIEAVYDIEGVEIDPDTVEMLTRSNVGRIASTEVLEPPRFDSVNAVVFQDGRTVDVSLKQNPDTYEPTLFVDSFGTPIGKK